MLGGSGSRRRTGLGFTRGESKKQLGVLGRMRANSTTPFGAVNPGNLVLHGATGNISLEVSSPKSISSNSAAMDAIFEKAKNLSACASSMPPYSNTHCAPAIPSCMQRARSIPPPPATKFNSASSGAFSASGASASGASAFGASDSSSSSELKELKELVTILQQRNKDYEKKLDSVQVPYYGLVKENIYFFKQIPTNDEEWSNSREGDASPNDWVPILHKEKMQHNDTWVSVLYMDPETGITDVFWTLKSGFAFFSLYPLLDKTIEDLV